MQCILRIIRAIRFKRIKRHIALAHHKVVGSCRQSLIMGPVLRKDSQFSDVGRNDSLRI